MIPRLLHFCYFGLDSTARNFPLVHYLAIRSAIECIRPEIVYFHNTREPGGKYWEALKSLVTRVPCEPPKQIFGRPLLHYSHQADIIRLQALIQTGGIYLDVDTLCRRRFDDLLPHSCVLGIQPLLDGTGGLGNAVILSEPHHPFLEAWLAAYKSFRSKGRDNFYDEHSVRIPWQLAGMTPAGTSGRKDLHIEPAESFFIPGWWPSDLARLFEQVEDFPRAYCHHLAESLSYRPYLETLTEQYILEVDTTYNLAARPFLPRLS
jgi:hypothetical protein